MKVYINLKSVVMCLLLICLFMACKKESVTSSGSAAKNNIAVNPADALSPTITFTQVNLVSDIPGYNALTIDSNLANAWGFAINPNGIFWVAANRTGVSTLYNAAGTVLRAPFPVDAADSGATGSPTGAVFNNTTDFNLPGTTTLSRFIFCSEDGIITAWGGGATATKAADGTAWHAVYKGMTIGNDGTDNFLYACDFFNGKIDVFDKNFKFVGNSAFHDSNIPAGYAPFNIRFIRNDYFLVTYAKQNADKEDDERGAGNGFVDAYSAKGKLIRRFASNGALNSPWGIAMVEQPFCSIDQKVLIGNFGDGKINVYSQDGTFQGPMVDANHQAIVIPGLWKIGFIPLYVKGNTNNGLFFAAGPQGEKHGLFGYIKCGQ
jgi:uncharacterized protein (TIGR03118 family)